MQRTFLRCLNEHIGNITLFTGRVNDLIQIAYDCCDLRKEYGFKVNRNSAKFAIIKYFRIRKDDWSTVRQLDNFTDTIFRRLKFHETNRKLFMRKYSPAVKSIYPKWANPLSS